MAHLKEILESQLAESANLGAFSSDHLQKELSAYRNRLFWSFLTVLIAVIMLAGFGAYLIAVHQKSPSEARTLAGALGITAGGCMEIARRLWSEWSRTGLVALLVEDAPEAVLRTVLTKLTQRL